MPAGSMYKSSGVKSKKVLNNKQLTRRVRALANTEGELQMKGGNPVSLALTANTGVIYYLDNLVPQAEDLRLHYIRFFGRIDAAASSYTRILFIRDNEPDSTDLTAGGVLENGNNYQSRYRNTGNDVAFGSKKFDNKNYDGPRRVQIIWDRLYSHVASTHTAKVSFIKTSSMYGIKTSEKCRYAFVVVSDAANTVDIEGSSIVTRLDI